MAVKPFHPLADKYPLMPEADLEGMAEDMRLRGFDTRFHVVLFEGKVLDGRNRCLAAEKAGTEPSYRNLRPEEDPGEFVRRANEHRRHLNQEWLRQRRLERIARVQSARDSGVSIRQIAKSEGITSKQVQRDLDASGVAAATPEEKSLAAEADSSTGEYHYSPVESPPQPEPDHTVTSGGRGCPPDTKKSPSAPKTVTGADGKTYPARKKKPKANLEPRAKARKVFDESIGVCIRSLNTLGLYAKWKPTLQQMMDEVKSA